MCDSYPCPVKYILSNQLSNVLQNIYKQYGWDGLTKAFNSDKQCTDQQCTSELTTMLTKLGEHRLKMIHCLHEKAKDILKPTIVHSILNEFGSTTITSDYDVAILSIYAPEICMLMFFLYVKQCTTSLSISFDTNLYTLGYFIKDTVYSEFERNMIFSKKDNIMGMQPINLKEAIQMILYSCMKLIDDTGILLPSHTMMQSKLIRRALAKYKFLTITIPSNISSDIHGLDQIHINYYLQYYFSINLYNMLFQDRTSLHDTILYSGRVDSLKLQSIFDNIKVPTNMNWVDLSCIGSFYQIDAYYTFCSTNAIVLDMQCNTAAQNRNKKRSNVLSIHRYNITKKKSKNIFSKSRSHVPVQTTRICRFINHINKQKKFKKINYVCACIENIGGLLRLQKEDLPIQVTISKIHKYIARIEFCIHILIKRSPKIIEELLGRLTILYHSLTTDGILSHKRVVDYQDIRSFFFKFKRIACKLIDIITIHYTGVS